MRIRRRLVVGGRVQGVFFRDSCRSQALSAGVAGLARNRADGRVEVVLEGEPGAVDRVVAWCHRGPSGARVGPVEVEAEEPEGLSGFSIG